MYGSGVYGVRGVGFTVQGLGICCGLGVSNEQVA